MKLGKGLEGLRNLKHNYNSIMESLCGASHKEIERFKRSLEAMLPKYYYNTYDNEGRKLKWCVNILWEVSSDPYGCGLPQRKFIKCNISEYNYSLTYDVKEGVVRRSRSDQVIMYIDKDGGDIII
jgi:hypothetical protein